MTPLAFALILLSALLHCGWNALLKGHSPSLAFVLLLNCFSCLVMLPFLFAVPLPVLELPGRFWLCLAGSVAGELLFNVVLVQGYRRFDLSQFYPLVRALPVAMLAGAAYLLPLGRKTPSPWALLGMALIFAGCLGLGLGGRPQDGAQRAMPWRLWSWSILGALGTCFYTGFDSSAAELASAAENCGWTFAAACAYFVLMVFGLSLGAAILVMASPAERRSLRKSCGNLRIPLLAGCFNAVCYTLILFAYSRTDNAALAFAARQIGLPISFLFGVAFFHEKITPVKIAGMALVGIGLLLAGCL